MEYFEIENFDDGEGTLTYAVSATPSAQSLTLTGKDPTVLGAGIAVQATSQNLVLTLGAPTYNYDFVTKPSANSLSLASPSPTLVLGDSIAPNALTLSLTQNVPSYILGETIIPLTRPMLLAMKTPTIIGTANVLPSAQSLNLSIKEPSITINETMLVSTLGMNLTQNTPNYIVGDAVIPSTLTLTGSARNPTISIVNPNVLQSELVYKNAIAVTQAKLTIISTTISTNFIPYLSNDNGSTWESTTSGITHTFSDPTGEEVKYKIYASPGTVLTKVILKVN